MNSGLVVSLLAALASGVLSHLYFTRLEAEVSGGARVPILVAATDVPIGTLLTEGAVGVRDVPQAYVESRQVRAAEMKKAMGARAATGLKANDAILWTDLATFNDRRRVLSGLVENGMRAVTVDGRTVTFDGLLRAGDRVDVLLTTGGQNDAAGRTVTLLQNLLVLAVGGLMVAGDEDAKGFGRGTSVSLSATMEQAERLTLSAQQGRLTLTLRNPDDLLLVEDVPVAMARDLEPRGLRVDSAHGVSISRERIEHVR